MAARVSDGARTPHGLALTLDETPSDLRICVRCDDVRCAVVRRSVLAVGRWPADARSAVDDVMASVGAQMNAAQGCARGKTIADFNAAWDYADPHPGAAQVLRAKLGLPAAG